MKRIYQATYTNRLTLGNKVKRLLWGVVWGVFGRFSPTPFFGWRRWLARSFGARLADDAKLYPKVVIWAPWNLEMGFDSSLANGVDCYSVDTVSIGNEVTVSQDAMLCTASHDIRDPGRRLVTKPIRIGDGAWVFARAFVGPGVEVGTGAVVAAAAVVVKDVPAWKVVGGNPARVIKDREYPISEEK